MDSLRQVELSSTDHLPFETIFSTPQDGPVWRVDLLKSSDFPVVLSVFRWSYNEAIDVLSPFQQAFSYSAGILF